MISYFQVCVIGFTSNQQYIQFWYFLLFFLINCLYYAKYSNYNLRTMQTTKDEKYIKGLNLMVYVTTWNVGFSEPPTNLAETSRNFLFGFEQYHIVAIVLQECKPNSWIEFFQNLFNKKFCLLSVVTMWRVINA